MTPTSSRDLDPVRAGTTEGSPVEAAPEVLWSPPADVRHTSRIGHYLGWLEQRTVRRFDDYAALWQWSVSDLSGFWASIWDYFELPDRHPGTPALAHPVMPGAKWFVEERLNYAEQVLRLPGCDDDTVVVLGRSQARAPYDLTVAELRDQVARARAGLVRLGVQPGERVAAYLPNIPEALVLLLATASIGATFSSCAPEFGIRSVTDRWLQIEPAVLVAVDGYRYGDKAIDRSREVAAIREALPSLRHLVHLPYLDPTRAPPPGATSWAELVSEPTRLAFEPVSFDHPLYVLYSSGTTGLPKPIVHGHGGILLEHLKALALHMDLGPGDRFFWYTTTGWMMWNYLVSGLAVGSAVVLFDGDPAYAGLTGLWQLAAETGATYFGTSAPYLLACRKRGVEPAATTELTRVRGVGSTGAPLPAEGFRWVYEHVGRNILLMSFSGGTDVCTGFLGGAPLLPVYAGEIACRCLGCCVEAYDESGRPVIGELGELVITKPMPSMPVGFWGDVDGSRYRAAYFADFPGVWRHGDWITITERGTCIVAGRSDATLNRGGVRLGTAEFYSVVESLPEVVESLVVHLDDPSGGPGQLVLFVGLEAGRVLDSDLRKKIAVTLREQLSPRHVPDELYAVPAVPRTLSGKKLEVPVKRILLGTPVDEAAAKGALANPESLEAFERLSSSRQRN